METTKNELIEIDIMFLLNRLWDKKIIIIATTLLFGALITAYNTFIVKPEYKSTTKIYAVNKNDKDKSLTVQDIQIGTNLVKDYQEIILSADVLDKVISQNNLEISPSSLAGKVAITAPRDTRVISITVSDTDAQRASNIANSFRAASAEKISNITKVNEITTIEEATPATSPSSPNIKQNAVIAILSGLVLSAGLIVLKELLDDRVKRPEDVEEVMNITLLGYIPDSKKGKK